ncbi:hypothetical protein ABZ924_12830 [Streptomyces sp. NPDC046876]|uniref:hypothetical protein n=1 Tax=Streptomyces sp. NPDC046876 TaxID=3155616 RepID=UPI0033CA4227
MDIHIKTHYVRQSAGGTDSAAAKALENLRKSLDSSDTAADGHHGWASAAALKRCATAGPDGDVKLTQHTSSFQNVSLDSREHVATRNRGEQRIHIVRPHPNWY